MKEITKYHNDMNTVSFRKFNAVELDLFFTICSKIRDNDCNVVTYSFEELQDLSNYKGRSRTRFIDDLQSTYNKLITCPFKIETTNTITVFVLFTRYRINLDDDTIDIKVNDEFKYILNELTSNFTRFELEEFTSLKSSYSKNMYKLLKQYRKTGKYYIKLDEFKRLLDIPESYRMTNIDQFVLSHIKKELPKCFKNLEISKVKNKNRVIAFEFSFEPENNNHVFVVEDEKGKKKYRQKKKVRTIGSTENWYSTEEDKNLDPEKLENLKKRMQNVSKK